MRFVDFSETGPRTHLRTYPNTHTNEHPPSTPQSPTGPGTVAKAEDDGTQYFVRCGRCNAAYAVAGNLVGPDGGRVKCEVRT